MVASIGPSIWETFPMLNENADSASADGREISTPMVSPFTTGDHRTSAAAASRENDRPDSALPAPADSGSAADGASNPGAAFLGTRSIGPMTG